MTCEEHLTAMVPYLKDELEPLRRTRIESHLGHCESCAAVRDRLAAGLDAARDWQPELEPDELDRRVARLGPYLADSSPTPRLAWLAGAAIPVVLIAVGVVLWTGRDEAVVAPEEPTTVFDFSDGLSFDVIPGEPALTRHEPTPYVRLIAPRHWDGAMVRQGRRTTIEMSRGFVAVAFAGGKGRRLRIRTPLVQVDVVGTRFVVDVAENDVTTVAVSQGRVRVQAHGRTVMVRAGQVRAVDASGEVSATAPPSTRYLEDEYLVSHTPPRPKPARPTREPRDEPRPTIAISDVLDQLARAEDLANDDQVAAAITIFQSCAEDQDASYDPYRDLCRLQLARLLGFKQGEPAAARRLLERLARRPGPVAREAALTLCELALERDPCRAKACLEEIAAADESARPEVTGLLARWRLLERTCR
jgi:hypothetical protein